MNHLIVKATLLLGCVERLFKKRARLLKPDLSLKRSLSYKICTMLSKNSKTIYTLGRAALHTSCVQKYQINYEQLRRGTEHQQNPIQPKTVRGNVKNMVGWRGGAERGFLAAYPDCIHVLTQEGTMDIPDMARWYRKVLTHNLATNVLKQRYGILVPITYR